MSGRQLDPESSVACTLPRLTHMHRHQMIVQDDLPCQLMYRRPGLQTYRPRG